MDQRSLIGRAGGLAALAGLMVGVSGCSHTDDAGMAAGKSETVVVPGDFVGTEPAASSTETMAAAKPKLPVTPVGEAVRIGAPPLPAPVLNIGGTADVAAGAGTTTVAKPESRRQSPFVTTVGPPSPPTTPSTSPASAAGNAPEPAGKPMVIDAVVGQINGRPVFATEILEPLDGRLRAIADKARSLGEWRNGAIEEAIKPELYARIKDELILSEARQSLSPEQKQGLLQFLGQIESSIVSQNAGSQVKADEQLREQKGRTLKREAEDVRDQELIRHEIETKVVPRVSVPWRDVQNEYEKQYAKYHPPAEYLFRMIYTNADKADNIAKVKDSLAAGMSFAEVAGMACNEYIPAEKGKLERKFSGPQSEEVFSDWPEINSALRTVGVGQTLGPIEFTPDKYRPGVRRIAWVHLERVDQPKAVSLYDAQLDIESDLREERLKAEQRRYFERLFGRGNVSRIDLMLEKLLNIATDRYASRLKGN